MVAGLINANPIVYEKKERRPRTGPVVLEDEYAVESIDQLEIFDILAIWFMSWYAFRNIAQLAVVFDMLFS